MIKDCNGVPLPIFAKSTVESVLEEQGAVPKGSVQLLTVTIQSENEEPLPGQFYMLHAERSDFLLSRPISVYHSEIKNGNLEIQFMILLKGKGTQELCSLRNGDVVNLLGPCGNRFQYESQGTDPSAPAIAIIGGGIGVAPVAGFAATLPEKSYDFFASFKSGSYGLEYVKPANLTITTDDGSVGVHGMLSEAFTEELLAKKNYSAVYACGPTPMLAYVQKTCKAAGVKCYLSMEAHMACGVGVCLGCAITTTQGKKRCCKDGPIFDGEILIFEPPKKNPNAKNTPMADSEKPDLSFTFKGVRFENPVIGSSGTFGFGTEYKSVFDVNRLGGISSKGLTLEPRNGNDGIRLLETPAGLMNSIGLQNPGIPHFIEHELPEMMALKPVAIANLSGSSLETYVEGAILLEKTDVPVIELNISCPNVKAGGAAFGMTCDAASSVVKAVREVTTKPLIVKLTPQAPDLAAVAISCIENGADAISLCNSFQGIAIDIERGVPVFNNIKAGVGGPAVRPIAVRLIYELVQTINSLPKEKQVPVFAIGGISTWQDAVEFIMAGASALQVGTATFANPFAMIEIIDGLEAFMKRKGYKNLDEMRGIVHQ